MRRSAVLGGVLTLALLGVAPGSASAAGGVSVITASRAAAATVTVADRTAAFEDAVTIPVQVTAVGATPSGTVTISRGGSALGSATVTGGTADVALPRDLPVGEHLLTASYSGDGSVGAGEASFVFRVVKAEVSLGFAKERKHGWRVVKVFVTAPSVPDPQFPGSGPNGAAPRGEVALREGTRVLGTAPVVSITMSMTASNVGVARIEVPARLLPAGTHRLTAAFSGSASFNASELQQAVTVAKEWSTTTAVVRPGRPRRGAPVQLRLGVRTETGRTAAGGRLVVKIDGRAISARLRHGRARVALGVLRRGPHVARVVYRGTSNVDASRTRVKIMVP